MCRCGQFHMSLLTKLVIIVHSLLKWIDGITCYFLLKMLNYKKLISTLDNNFNFPTYPPCVIPVRGPNIKNINVENS